MFLVMIVFYSEQMVQMYSIIVTIRAFCSEITLFHFFGTQYSTTPTGCIYFFGSKKNDKPTSTTFYNIWVQ